MKLTRSCIWGALLFSVLGSCSEATAKNTLVLAGGDISKTRCSLPALSSTTAGARFVDAFSEIQKGWTYKQLRSHIDIAPATPEPVQLYGLAAYTVDYTIYLANNLSLDAGILLDRNKKVKSIDVGLSKNAGQQNQKVCTWQFQMR